MSEPMDFAAAAARPPLLQVQAGAGASAQVRHIDRLHPFAVLVDLKAVRPNVNKDERNRFVLRDLGVPALAVSGIYAVPTSQLLRINFLAEAPYEAALERLRDGVPWSEMGGSLVYGWSVQDSLVKLRLSGVPEHLAKEVLVAHLGQWGRVVAFSRGRDRDFPVAFDGTVYITFQLGEQAVLPAFITLVEGSRKELIMLHTDQSRRHCYRCGHTGHVGQYCKAGGRMASASAGLWSTLVLPGRAVGDPFAPSGPSPASASAPLGPLASSLVASSPSPASASASTSAPGAATGSAGSALLSSPARSHPVSPSVSRSRPGKRPQLADFIPPEFKAPKLAPPKAKSKAKTTPPPPAPPSAVPPPPAPPSAVPPPPAPPTVAPPAPPPSAPLELSQGTLQDAALLVSSSPPSLPPTPLLSQETLALLEASSPPDIPPSQPLSQGTLEAAAALAASSPLRSGSQPPPSPGGRPRSTSKTSSTRSRSPRTRSSSPPYKVVESRKSRRGRDSSQGTSGLAPAPARVEVLPSSSFDLSSASEDGGV